MSVVDSNDLLIFVRLLIALSAGPYHSLASTSPLSYLSFTIDLSCLRSMRDRDLIFPSDEKVSGSPPMILRRHKSAAMVRACPNRVPRAPKGCGIVVLIEAHVSEQTSYPSRCLADPFPFSYSYLPAELNYTESHHRKIQNAFLHFYLKD